MRKLILLPFLIFCFVATSSNSALRIMFYNVENYFDVVDDPDKNDNDFLPGGKKHWTSTKLDEKKNAIAKVIAAVGKGEPPAIVGLAEVENDYVLKLLTKYSPLKKWKYKFVHYDSPDPRGIDVALLYDAKQFDLISSINIPVKLPSGKTTRDVLYVSGKTTSGDTLHVFVCHAPSRIGGKNQSEYKRVIAMSVVRQHCDSIFLASPHANIIIMGDFNDTPQDKSMSESLGAIPLVEQYESTQLYNMCYQFLDNPYLGTHKYQSQWSVLDQIIVSGNLLISDAVKPSSAYIFRAPFLLEDDKRNMDVRPKRTYNGFKYNGGYSDHLPVVVEIF